jgi:hypothetical protein
MIEHRKSLDSISEARLSLICPRVAVKVRDLASVLSFPIRVTQGLRGWNEQSALYEQGRSLPGKIVTKAQPGHSWHNFGLAVDVVPDDLERAGFQPDWNLTHPQWQTLESAARALGFVCGADFRTFPDWPHLQITGRFPASPDDEVRLIFRCGGMEEVWKEAGI